MREIVVIGGGAAGMAAALRASEQPDTHVTMLERQNRIGRKLLSTGNGRCNLTNTGASAANYHGADPIWVQSILDRYSPDRVLDFFGKLGLVTVTEYGGRVYPKSNHASSVLDVLRLALERENLEVRTSLAAEHVHFQNGSFRVTAGGESFRSNRLIIACGGCAGSKLGGVMDGYELLKELGHTRTPLYPALTQLRTASDYPKSLKGIKVDARIRLLSGERTVAEAVGDILFTENGLSGTAVMELSRAASAKGPLTASLCLFEEEESTLFEDLCERRDRWPEQPGNQILTGAVQSRLGQMLCKESGISGGTALAQITDPQLRKLAAVLRDFRLPVSGVSGFDAAQVTAGGIRTEEFSAETLESRIVPGLYACGEVLDVDGDCGGYNLQWAWASGLLAGELR